MKVLHLIFSLNIGGSESMMVDIANRQIVNNDVYVYIVNSAYNQILLDSFNDNIKIHLFNRKEGSKNPFKILEINWAIYKLKPDIVHCHDADINKIFFIHPFIKTLLTVHAIDLPLIRISKFNKIVAISSAVKEYLLKRKVTNVSVIYNGVETSTIDSKKDQIAHKPFKIVQVGRLNHCIKGQHILIEALMLLITKHKISDIHLDFIGEGSSFSFLKDLVNKYELADKVTFHGIKDRSFIYSNLKNYDLLVQPSIIEGFGLTVVEGMSAKIPVLVSKNDGPMEIIQNGKYGFYFEKENATDCANQIRKIIISREKVNQIVENAYEYCLKNFDIDKTVEKYFMEYQK